MLDRAAEAIKSVSKTVALMDPLPAYLPQVRPLPSQIPRRYPLLAARKRAENRVLCWEPSDVSTCHGRRAFGSAGTGGQAEWRPTCQLTAAGPLVDFQQLHLELERGVGRNDTTRSADAVSQVWRNGKLALSADLHPHNPLVPAGNDVTGAK